MLYTSKVFRMYLAPSRGGKSYTRTATGEEVAIPLDDDIVSDEREQRSFYEVFPVTSLLGVRQYFKLLRAFNTVATVVAWVGLVIICYHTFVRFFASGLRWTDYIAPAVLATVVLLYTPQVLRPIAHDSQGHWINLRTGANNLNDGKRIR